MAVHTPLAAKRSKAWNSELADRIDEAIAGIDWDSTDAYSDLSELAQQVEIVGHVLDIDSTIVDGKSWTTPGTVFVTLNYDVNSSEPVSIDDAYPIFVKFNVADNVVEITKVSADTSSFYE